MIVVRFTVQCRSDRTEEVAEVLRLVDASALTRDLEWTVWEASVTA